MPRLSVVSWLFFGLVAASPNTPDAALRYPDVLYPGKMHFAKEPVRYQNMTWQQFDYNLRHNIPFILTDAASRWKASKIWRAEWFEERFPFEELLPFQALNTLDPYGESSQNEDNLVSMGADPFANDFEFESVGMKEETSDLAAKPSFQLSISKQGIEAKLWDKEQPAPEITRLIEMRQELYDMVDIPYPVATPKPSLGDIISFRNLLEIWFGKEGAGTLPHLDLLETIFTTQFVGRKRWQIRVLPFDAKHKSRSELNVHMLDLLKANEQADRPWYEYEFVLNPGETFVMPAGSIHASKTLPVAQWPSMPKEAKKIAVSTSMQIDLQ
jgi:hypothetical protein